MKCNFLFHLVFSLIAATVCAFHCIAPRHTNFTPHNNPRCGFLGLLHHKTAAAHAECRCNLVQHLWQSLDDQISGKDN